MGSGGEKSGFKVSTETHSSGGPGDTPPHGQHKADRAKMLQTQRQLTFPAALLTHPAACPGLGSVLDLASFATVVYSTSVFPSCFPLRTTEEAPGILEGKGATAPLSHLLQIGKSHPQITEHAGGRPGSRTVSVSSPTPSLPHLPSQVSLDPREHAFTQRATRFME